MPVLSPFLSKDNSIGYLIGIQFKLNQVFEDGSRREVTLLEAEEEKRVFYGMFDVEDTDFEVIVDNRSDQEDIQFEIKFPDYLRKIGNPNTGQTYKYKYSIKKGRSDQLKALEPKGSHLHFISQETSQGRLHVGLFAIENGVSYEEAAVYSSRIEFFVKAGSLVEIPDRNGVIYIKNLKGKDVVVVVSQKCTLAQLKDWIEDHEGIPSDQQIIILGKLKVHTLPEHWTLKDVGIEFESTLQLLLRLRGGIRTTSGQPSEIPEKSEEYPQLGERGVVCFGKKTRQRFRTNYGFQTSEEYELKPFTIELRVKSK